jgi:hypothetical protein
MESAAEKSGEELEGAVLARVDEARSDGLLVADDGLVVEI